MELESLIKKGKACDLSTPNPQGCTGRVTDLLTDLADVHVDLETLRQTNAGHIINDRWLRLHSVGKIRSASKKVADNWKNQVGVHRQGVAVRLDETGDTQDSQHPGELPCFERQYTGNYRGTTWNTQAIFASDIERESGKQNYVKFLMGSCDFGCFTETHSDAGRVLAANLDYINFNYWWLHFPGSHATGGAMV